MNYTRFIPVLFGAMFALTPLASCSDDKNGSEPNPPETPETPVTPPAVSFSPLEPLMAFGEDVPYIKTNEKRNLRRDTTKVSYGYQTIRTLIYDGGENDIAFYYYYHFKHAELYQTEMLCPVNPEVTHLIDSIFDAQYKYWRWNDVYACDTYLAPDSSLMIRKEIWTDESIGMDLYRVVYDPTSAADIKKYYE